MDIQQAIRSTLAGQTTFFDNAHFPWTKHVETPWPGIRAEADRVLAASDQLPGNEEIQEYQRQLSTDKRWQVFPFLAYGHEIFENQEYCPLTSQALDYIPGIKAAMYSILRAGKVLPVHVGPYNGVLRYHLGITLNPKSVA